MFKYFILLLSFLSACASQQMRTPSGQSVPVAPFSEPSDNQAKTLSHEIAKEMSSAIQVLEQDIYVFHYMRTDYPVTGKVTSFSENPENYLKSGIDYFFSSKQSISSLAGAGLYVALDPYASAEFGSPNFGLFEIRLPKGTRFITQFLIPQHKDSRKFMLSEGLKRKLNTFTCKNLDDLDEALRDQTKLSCRQVVLDAYKEAKIDFISYSYDSYSPSWCGRKLERALVILNSGLISDHTWKFFTPSMPSDSETQQEQIFIKALMQNYALEYKPYVNEKGVIDPDPNDPLKLKLWKNAWPETIPNGIDLKAWTRSHLYNCQ